MKKFSDVQKKGTDYLSGDKLGLRAISKGIVAAIEDKIEGDINNLYVESIIRGEVNHVFMIAKINDETESKEYEFDLPKKRKYFFI